MKPLSCTVIVGLLAGLAPVVAVAQSRAPAQPIVLGPDEAIARGLAASRRLAELQARERGADAAVEGRRIADRPVVAIQGGYTRTSDIPELSVLRPDGTLQVLFPNIPDRGRTRLDLRWPIYAGGRDDALERAARAERAAVGEDLAVARLDLRLEITRAYWALVTADQSVRVLDAALQRVDAHWQAARDRLAVGLTPPNEVLSVEAERSRQEVLLIEARNLREVSAADLRRLADLDPAAPLQLSAPLEEPGEAPADLEALVTEALSRRPERQALGHRIAALDGQMDAAGATLRPDVSLAGGYDYARPNTLIVPPRPVWRGSWDVGVSVRWNLWDGGRARAEMAQAEAGRDALRERLEEFDSVLRVEVRQRLLDVDAARAASRAARDGVRAAAEARRVVVDRFEAGVATSLDELDAEEDLLRAELNLTRALANIRLAGARLARALGR